MPPHRRKVVSCQTCRRLKTRCEVPTGSVVCSRCKALRVPCELPLDTRIASQTPTGLESVAAGSPPGLIKACTCEERLDALEAELEDLRSAVRELGRCTTSHTPQSTLRNRNPTALVQQSPQVSRERARDRTVATAADPPVAPVRDVRKMYTWINGECEDPQDSVELSEPVRAHLASNGLGLRLIETSRKTIPRLHFMQEAIDRALDGEYNLLSVTCLLAGMQTNPSVSTAELHSSLYAALQSGLAKLALESPLSMPSLYAMLLGCVMNLTLGYSHGFIDTWLLSGSLTLHLILSLDFAAPAELPYTQDTKSRILTWNSACLQHLKFTIGVGKISAVRLDLAGHYIDIVKHTDNFEEPDKEVAIELELFILLYRGIIEGDTSSKQLQSAFSQWQAANAKLLHAEKSLALRIAMSTFSLLAHRWELYQLQQEDIEGVIQSTLYNQHVEPILRQSHRIIEFVGELTQQQTVLHTFDFLIGAYAHVTLVEFSGHLTDIQKTFRLMEEVQKLRKDTYVFEPVSSWATNMMKKRVVDAARSEVQLPAHTLTTREIWWPPFKALNSRMEHTSSLVDDRGQR